MRYVFSLRYQGGREEQWRKLDKNCLYTVDTREQLKRILERKYRQIDENVYFLDEYVVKQSLSALIQGMEYGIPYDVVVMTTRRNHGQHP